MCRLSKLFVLFLTVFALVFVPVAAQSQAQEQPASNPSTQQETEAEPIPLEGVVNINTAEVEMFALLPRIGEKIAERIIQYRADHGPFTITEELMLVRGIGEKTYERFAGFLSVEGESTLKKKQ